MAKYCKHCGAQLGAHAKFCKGCGARIERIQAAAVEIAAPAEASVTVSNVMPAQRAKNAVAALGTPGEMMLGDFADASKTALGNAAAGVAQKAAKGTIGILVSGLADFFVNIGRTFTSFKAILSMLAAVLVWTLLPLLSQGIPDWLLTLTMSTGDTKGAADLASLTLGRFAFLCGLGSLPSLLSKSAGQKLQRGKVAFFIIGLGAALVLGTFAADSNLMGALGLLVCVLGAKKKRDGFLWKLAASLGRNEDALQLLNGAAVGSALAAAVSITEFGGFGLGLGLATFVVGIVLKFIGKGAANAAAGLLLALLLSSNLLVANVAYAVSNDDYWTLYDVTVNTENSSASLSVSDGESPAYATDSVSITITSPTSAEIHFSIMNVTTTVEWDAPPDSFPADKNLSLSYRSSATTTGAGSIIAYFSDGNQAGAATNPLNSPLLRNVTTYISSNGPLYYNVYIQGGSYGGEVQVVYEYRRSKAAPVAGGDSVDTIAGNILGDDLSSAVDIPGTIMGAAAAAAAAGAAVKRRRKKGEKEEPPQEQEKEKPRSTFRMILTKDFGDTIEYDAKPLPVYARIVELTSDGRMIERQDLTQRIKIFSATILDVSQNVMSGKYMAAYVSVKSTAAELQDSAQISVRFEGPEGVFQNNITFKLLRYEILFPVDNITLPANYNFTTELQFATVGMGDNTSVSVTLGTEKDFSLFLERDAQNPELWNVIVTELGCEKCDAGSYDAFTLQVTAKNDLRVIEDSLPVYRYHAGLRVDIPDGAIACYGAAGKPVGTEVFISLYTWDEESHHLIKAVPADVSFDIKAENSEICDRLRIACELRSVDASSMLCCMAFPTAALLDPPNRYKAAITVGCTRNGERITAQREVMLNSQPRREFADSQAYDKAVKEDKHITDNLLHYRSYIWSHNALSRLFPLYNLIGVMLEGYDPNFGYDSHQVDAVRSVFVAYATGNFAGANAQAEDYTLVDLLRQTVKSTYYQVDESVEAFENSLGFIGRMGLGYLTKGGSEAVFTAFRVPREMLRYAEQGGESVIEGFWVGTKIVLWEVAPGKLADYAAARHLAGSKKLPSGADQLKKATQAKGSTVKGYSAAGKAAGAKKAIGEAGKAKEAAEEAARQLRTRCNGRAWTPEELAEEAAFFEGSKKGLLKMKELANARAQLKMYPESIEAADNFKRLALEVQADKHAISQLNDYAGLYGDDLRAEFNRVVKTIYDKTDLDAIDDIAQQTGIAKDKLFVFNATGNSAEKLQLGRSIARDRDITYMYHADDGSIKEVPWKMQEKAYNRSFAKNATGVEVLDDTGAAKVARKYDQTVVAEGSPEKFPDLSGMIDPKEAGRQLSDLEGTRAVVIEKCETPYLAALKEADPVIAEELKRESSRQASKSACLARNRLVGARANGADIPLSPKDESFLNFICTVKDDATITSAEYARVMKYEFGLTPQQSFEYVADIITKTEQGR